MFRTTLALTTLFVFFHLSPASAQNPGYGNPGDKPVRIEIPASSDAETYRILPFGKDGFMLFFKSREVVNDTMIKWYFACYDQDIRQVWIKSVAVPASMDFFTDMKRSDTLMVLFQVRDKEKNSFFSHMVLRVLLQERSFVGNYTKIPAEAELSSFQSIGRFAYFALNVKNKPAIIQVLDLFTGAVTIRPTTTVNASSILSMTLDTLNGRILISLKKFFNKTAYENYLLILDQEANAVAEILISPITANRFIHDLNFYPVSRDDLIVCGTYGFGDGKKGSSRTNAAGDIAGIFCCSVKNGAQHDISLTNFLELKNITSVLDDRDNLILQKKKARNNGNVSDLSLNLNILMHPVQRHENQFIVYLESYMADYQNESYTEFDFYGRPYTVTVPVFEGYRFTNGIVAAFDQNSRLLWDNTMEVRNLKTFDLAPRQNIVFTGTKAVLSYSGEGKIASKIIRGGDVVEPLDFTSIELLRPEDKLISDTRSRMIPWYDNFYLCYGYEEIKNISLPENNKRMVFYCTKIRYE